MFAFPSAIRKIIYTTNAVEAMHRSLRKIIKTRGAFPSDEAARKLLFLAIRNAGLRWRRPIAWTEAMSQFAILPLTQNISSSRMNQRGAQLGLARLAIALLRSQWPTAQGRVV